VVVTAVQAAARGIPLTKSYYTEMTRQNYESEKVVGFWLNLNPAATSTAPSDSIIAVIEASESRHQKLAAKYHRMSALLDGSLICSVCQSALIPLGITSTDSMIQAARKLGMIHRGMKPPRI
jgi:hypothetical protein